MHCFEQALLIEALTLAEKACRFDTGRNARLRQPESSASLLIQSTALSVEWRLLVTFASAPARSVS